MMKVPLRQLSLLSLLAASGFALDYAIDNPGSLSLADVATGISPILTIFKGDQFNVTVVDVSWTESEISTDSTTLFWTTTIDGALVGEGNYSLAVADVGRELPDTFFVGTYVINSKQTATIVVTFTLDDVDSETSGDYQVYASGLAIVPLIIVLVLAMTTRMVRTQVCACRCCLWTGTSTHSHTVLLLNCMYRLSFLSLLASSWVHAL
jgi:hypothetical protein